MEKINIASFDFDTTLLETSLSKLNERYFELSKAKKIASDLMKIEEQEIAKLVKANLALADAEGDNTDAIEANNKAIEAHVKSVKSQYNEQQKVALSMRSVKDEINQTEKQLKSYMNSMGTYQSLQTQANAALQREIKNKNEARAANLELQKISNQLNPQIEEEAELLKQVNAQIDANTQYIKENSSATAQQAMNVGNYTESIKEALTQINPFNGGLGGFVDRAKQAGGLAPLLKNTFSAITTGLAGATKAGLAFIATPIGAAIAALAATIAIVVGAFKFMKASMESTEEGSNKLAKVTAIVSGAMNALWKILKPLGEFLGEVFIAYIETAAAAVDMLVGAVSDGLRFLGFDDAADSIDGFSNSVKQGVKDAQELAQAEADLAKANREAQRTQLEYQKQAEKLRQLRDDESKSIDERIKANEDLGRVLKEQLAAELAIANQALKVAQLRIKADGESAEALDAQAEALTRISDIQERITGQESEQLTNLNSLRREAAQQEKERREKAAEAYRKQSEEMVKSMELELQTYIAGQGIRKKSMEEQLAFDKEVYDKQVALAKKQLERKLISQKEYELQLLELQNEFAQRQVDAVIANADFELQEFKNANQRKIDQARFFSEELYLEEVDRMNRVTEAELANQRTRFEQGLINEREYRLAIAQIEQNAYNEHQAVLKEREEAEKAKRENDLALQIELDAQNFQYNLDLQLAQFEQQYAQEKAIAEKNGADMTLFEEAQAKKRLEIEQMVKDNKLALASETFGNLATIAGEESELGKAFAVMQTTIDTYQAATAAYKAMAGIPVVGPALGAAAAAAAVVAGIKNVRQITAVKPAKAKNKPSYATGVIGVNGIGTGVSDNIDANISSGESIITNRATEMFPNTLGALNQLGGGVGLDGTLSSIIAQQGVSDKANSAFNIDAMAEAVAKGAAIGTAKGAADGMIGLSDNRKVMADAKI